MSDRSTVTPYGLGRNLTGALTSPDRVSDGRASKNPRGSRHDTRGLDQDHYIA